MSTRLSPLKVSLCYTDSPKSAPLKWRLECSALEKIRSVKFLWLTCRLMMRLAKSEFSVSCYDPQVQEWAAQRLNAQRYRILCKEQLDVPNLIWEGGSLVLVI
jgi:hypothetical protein